MIPLNANASIVRLSAIYDVVVTAPFATPWTFWILHSALAQIHTLTSIDGSFPVPTLLGVLFANLLGSVVIVWALVRIINPTRQLGRFDALARVLFAVWQVVAVIAGLSPIILVFTLVEIVFFVLQVLPVAEVQSQTK